MEKFKIENEKDIANIEKEFNEGGRFFGKNKDIILFVNGKEIQASVGCRTIPEQYYAKCLPYGIYMSQTSWDFIRSVA